MFTPFTLKYYISFKKNMDKMFLNLCYTHIMIRSWNHGVVEIIKSICINETLPERVI